VVANISLAGQSKRNCRNNIQQYSSERQ
jgi:hypothetical protein